MKINSGIADDNKGMLYGGFAALLAALGAATFGLFRRFKAKPAEADSAE